MNSIIERHNVKTMGKGEKVLFFAHGFGCDQNSWNKIASAFEANYKLVFFDYIGAGKTDANAYDRNKYSSLEGYSKDVLEIAQALKLKDAVFIGHSVSCMIGALAAISMPTIFEKLIFVAPSPCYLNDEAYEGGFEQEHIDTFLRLLNDDFIGWANATAPFIMGESNPLYLKEELTESFCTVNQAIAKDFAKVTFMSDNRKDLSRIPVPSLTLQCSRDILAPLYVGYYIKQNTPQNSLTIMEATGHCPHMSAPQETIEAIKAYL